VADGYQRLSAKHKTLAEAMEQDKVELVSAQTELEKLHDDLDLETRSYTEYHQAVHDRLLDLQRTVASYFGEVKVQCLPFSMKGMPMEEMIDSIAA
jgi:hypothetical protein